MDRRTILAFVFIALIIILTPYYMKLVVGDQPVRSTPEVVDHVEKLPDAGESYERSASRPAAAPPEKQPTPQPSRQTTPPRASIAPVENFVARQVTVETDRFLATFSTRGGVLTSVRLKDYLDPLGREVPALRWHTTGNRLMRSNLFLTGTDWFSMEMSKVSLCSVQSWVLIPFLNASVSRGIGIALTSR